MLYRYFTSLAKCIHKYLVLFGAIVNEAAFFIFLRTAHCERSSGKYRSRNFPALFPPDPFQLLRVLPVSTSPLAAVFPGLSVWSAWQLPSPDSQRRSSQCWLPPGRDQDMGPHSPSRVGQWWPSSAETQTGGGGQGKLAAVTHSGQPHGQSRGERVRHSLRQESTDVNSASKPNSPNSPNWPKAKILKNNLREVREVGSEMKGDHGQRQTR